MWGLFQIWGQFQIWTISNLRIISNLRTTFQIIKCEDYFEFEDYFKFENHFEFENFSNLTSSWLEYSLDSYNTLRLESARSICARRCVCFVCRWPLAVVKPLAIGSFHNVKPNSNDRQLLVLKERRTLCLVLGECNCLIHFVPYVSLLCCSLSSS